MERPAALEAVVARLAAQFPNHALAEVERAATASWILFAQADDPGIREAATEWYARHRLRNAS